MKRRAFVFSAIASCVGSTQYVRAQTAQDSTSHGSSFPAPPTPAPAAAGNAIFNLNCGNDLPSDHPLNVRSLEAFARINAATNGRVQIKAFPASLLGSDAAMLAQLRSGALEMLALPGASITLSPLASIENLAFAFADRSTAFAAMDGNLGRIIRADIAAKGIVALDKIWEDGFRNITTATGPVRSAADVTGLKIRVTPTPISVDTFRSLGASPTPIAINEVYTALQTRIVDAQENLLAVVEQQKLYEVQRYVALSEHVWSGYWMLLNQDVWARLGASIQAIVTREMSAAALAARNDVANLNAGIQADLSRRGLAVNAVDKENFRQKLSGAQYYTRWNATFGSTAWSALEEYTGPLA
jgi:tripartite ATP-independent transporter DctP family solute receptor